VRRRSRSSSRAALPNTWQLEDKAWFASLLALGLRGFGVVVPVDAMSADDVFPELYTAWHLATAARISAKVTLTKLDMISF